MEQRTEKMDGFKVVERFRENVLVSPGKFPHDVEAEYPVGEWVAPKTGCGPLTIFDNLQDAVVYTRALYKWALDDEDYDIFHCEYDAASVMFTWFPGSAHNHADCMVDGTRLAKRLRVIRQVSHEEIGQAL